MADFDLTQTDAQVQSILNDAQDAMGAGAQTSLTTDYIMLKGTNGRYHKILKDSFTEAVRNTLAGLLVNNDKGTTISQIAAIASGDFGSVTPANLASVLGALGTNTTAPSDADDIITGSMGYKAVWHTTGGTNYPADWYFVIAFKISLQIEFQIGISVNFDWKYRSYSQNAGGWSDWKTITFT